MDPVHQHLSLRPQGAIEDVDARPPKVTIVLPCFNEQDHVLLELERMTAAMDANRYSYELLAIDDASTDGTLAILRETLDRFPNMRLMPFQRNGGSGTARRIGTREARGEIVVWTDADITYPDERIPEFVRCLDETAGCDHHKVLGVPAKWAIRKFAERITSTTIPDLNSGLRAFCREVSKASSPMG